MTQAEKRVAGPVASWLLHLLGHLGLSFTPLRPLLGRSLSAGPADVVWRWAECARRQLVGASSRWRQRLGSEDAESWTLVSRKNFC